MYPTFHGLYSWKRPIKNIQLIFQWVKWSVQRIRRGYNDFDAEEISSWFISIIPDMLRQFRKAIDEQKGFPSVLLREYYEKHQNEIGCTYNDFLCGWQNPELKEWNLKAETACRQRWKDTIDQMIFLFTESDEDTCQKKNPYPISKIGTNEYHEAEKDLDEYRKDCRKKAFDLFCKWYEYLWI